MTILGGPGSIGGGAPVSKNTEHGRKISAISIAACTQAGSTIDEDFPGWAALFGPDGKIVAELPDWQAGTLIIDI